MIQRLLFILLAVSFLFIGARQVNAQACSAPAVASGVTVDYPGCNGSSCDLTQASCSWDSQADATSYNITVTEVETGTIIKNNESQPSSTTKVLFNITQGRTYKCDVVSVSSCGGLAAAASDQLLCEADAIIDTPTPTQSVATPTPVPPTATFTPTPTLPPTGSVLQTVTVLGGILVVIVGGILLFVL